VVVAGLMLGACVLSFGAGPSSLASVVWALAGVIPFILLREFARRFTLADLHAGVTLLVDIAAVVLQLSLLAALAGTARLSAATAHGVIGIAGGCAGLAWLISARRHFGPCAYRWRDDMGRGWALGRWFLAGQTTMIVQSYGIHWLLALLLGLKTAGLYAACISIVSLSNPFIIGVGNILNPKAAWAFAHGGVHGLRRLVLRTTVVLTVATGIFALGLALVGGEAMRLIYGSEYAGYGMVVAILAAGPFIYAFGMAAGHGLTVIERSHWHLITSVAGAAVTLTAMMLLSPWGLLGAAWAYVAGNIVSTSLRCVAFWMIPYYHDALPAEADGRFAGTSHEALVPLATGN
jgi:O-antigen/teichoic acid export membrane protein